MREAAEALRLTAQDLNKLGVCDHVIAEPVGGAHRDRAATIQSVKNAISDMLADMATSNPKALIQDRRKKFLNIGSKGLAA
jgi:acetyl-CoA carboxylase carboxyl transferase subunit alpha